jgi:hypothetical protein
MYAFGSSLLRCKQATHCQGAARILADDQSVKLDLENRLNSSLDRCVALAGGAA